MGPSWGVLHRYKTWVVGPCFIACCFLTRNEGSCVLPAKSQLAHSCVWERVCMSMCLYEREHVFM